MFGRSGMPQSVQRSAGDDEQESPLSGVRPKYLERKPPRLSERKQAARDAAVAVIVDLLGRWRCSQADLAASAELSREAISMAMGKERPFSVEAILLLPDANALEAFDALRDIVKDRQRAGRDVHAVKLGRGDVAR